MFTGIIRQEIEHLIFIPLPFLDLFFILSVDFFFLMLHIALVAAAQKLKCLYEFLFSPMKLNMTVKNSFGSQDAAMFF